MALKIVHINKILKDDFQTIHFIQDNIRNSDDQRELNIYKTVNERIMKYRKQQLQKTRRNYSR